MAHIKKVAPWYSVTLNLARIAEVVPASHDGMQFEPDTSQTSVGFTKETRARYGWDHDAQAVMTNELKVEERK